MVTNVPEKLKLNKFKLVAIPKNRDYFARFGFAKSPASSYSGDLPAFFNEDKIGSLVRGEREVQRAICDENVQNQVQKGTGTE